MTDKPAAHSHHPAHCLPPIKAVRSDQPVQWLAMGLKDMAHAPWLSMLHGLVLAVLGAGITWVAHDRFWLLVGALSGVWALNCGGCVNAGLTFCYSAPQEDGNGDQQSFCTYSDSVVSTSSDVPTYAPTAAVTAVTTVSEVKGKVPYASAEIRQGYTMSTIHVTSMNNCTERGYKEKKMLVSQKA